MSACAETRNCSPKRLDCVESPTRSVFGLPIRRSVTPCPAIASGAQRHRPDRHPAIDRAGWKGRRANRREPAERLALRRGGRRPHVGHRQQQMALGSAQGGETTGRAGGAAREVMPRQGIPTNRLPRRRSRGKCGAVRLNARTESAATTTLLSLPSRYAGNTALARQAPGGRAG